MSMLSAMIAPGIRDSMFYWPWGVIRKMISYEPRHISKEIAEMNELWLFSSVPVTR